MHVPKVRPIRIFESVIGIKTCMYVYLVYLIGVSNSMLTYVNIPCSYTTCSPYSRIPESLALITPESGHSKVSGGKRNPPGKRRNPVLRIPKYPIPMTHQSNPETPVFFRGCDWIPNPLHDSLLFQYTIVCTMVCKGSMASMNITLLCQHTYVHILFLVLQLYYQGCQVGTCSERCACHMRGILLKMRNDFR